MAMQQMVCSNCGSTDVVRDAWAGWDPAQQTWVLSSVFDESYCNDCEASTSIESIPDNSLDD